MSEAAKEQLSVLTTKSKQVFDPTFFGLYSFEYAYRLFLVFLCTSRIRIQEVRVSDPNALNNAFENDIALAIRFTAEYRGINLNEDVFGSLLKLANDSCVLFIKSNMLTSPNKFAKTVTAAMDKQVAKYLGDGKTLIVPVVFSEGGLQ